MKPNASKLRDLRGATGMSVREAASAANIDWRTLASYELGEGTEKFQYNQLNQLASLYNRPLDELLERASAVEIQPIPTPITPQPDAQAQADAGPQAVAS